MSSQSLIEFSTVDIWPVMNKTTVVAKRELLYVWPFGVCAWLCGLIFIDRYAADKAKNTMTTAMEKLKMDNIKLWVFPEGESSRPVRVYEKVIAAILGTRRNTGVIHEFKKGAFHVAIQGQVPILPVVFSSYRTFLKDDLRILNSGEIIIEALPEIPTTGLTPDDTTQLMERTRQLMIDKFTEITKEIQLKDPQNLMSTWSEHDVADSPPVH